MSAADPISREFHEKSDRELLLLTAQTVNVLDEKVDKINSTVDSNTAKINRAEGALAVIGVLAGSGIIMLILRIMGYLGG